MFKRSKKETSSSRLIATEPPVNELEQLTEFEMSNFAPEVLCANLGLTYPKISQSVISCNVKACIKSVKFSTAQMVQPGFFTVELRDQPDGKGSLMQKRSGVSCKDLEAGPLTVTFAPPRLQLKPKSNVFLTLIVEAGEFNFELAEPEDSVGNDGGPDEKYRFEVAAKQRWASTTTNASLAISFKYT